MNSRMFSIGLLGLVLAFPLAPQAATPVQVNLAGDAPRADYAAAVKKLIYSVLFSVFEINENRQASFVLYGEDVSSLIAEATSGSNALVKANGTVTYSDMRRLISDIFSKATGEKIPGKDQVEKDRAMDTVMWFLFETTRRDFDFSQTVYVKNLSDDIDMFKTNPLPDDEDGKKALRRLFQNIISRDVNIKWHTLEYEGEKKARFVEYWSKQGSGSHKDASDANWRAGAPTIEVATAELGLADRLSSVRSDIAEKKDFGVIYRRYFSPGPNGTALIDPTALGIFFSPSFDSSYFWKSFTREAAADFVFRQFYNAQPSDSPDRKAERLFKVFGDDFVSFVSFISSLPKDDIMAIHRAAPLQDDIIFGRLVVAVGESFRIGFDNDVVHRYAKVAGVKQAEWESAIDRISHEVKNDILTDELYKKWRLGYATYKLP